MVETTVEGVTVGLAEPLFLVGLPAALLLVWYLVFRGRGLASARSRRLLFASRLLIVALLVVGAAGPYTVASQETRGDPRVTLLVDRSESMSVTDAEVERLSEAIEAEGVPVTTATVGEDMESRLGDGIAANLRRNGSVVVLSDGQVTDGRSLTEVTELARSLDARVSRVAVEPERTERYVELDGPTKTSQGIQSRFLARIQGVDAEGEVTLTVEVDGEPALERRVNGTDQVAFNHVFDTVGSHRVTASISGDDGFASNDVYRKTVRVVERPRVLYVSDGAYPLRSYLAQLYDVRTASSVPSDLSPYYAVVMQDKPAGSMGDMDALQRFVIDGNGLVVVGGENAYENGGYREAPIGTMLPVTVGQASGESANIVLLIDVSGSAGEGMRVQKAIALDVLNQLSDDNRVGIVGFNYRAYRVADIQPLSENRGELEDTVRRLQAGGATNIATGLRGAGQMLDGERGTVILVSDGRDRTDPAATAAANLGQQGIQVISVGVGSTPKEDTLKAVADRSGGSYLRATETDRLRILFGGPDRQFQGQGLTVVDEDDFITSGVTLTAAPGLANDVSMRRGANFLVATEAGTPAVASWRFGLGRVVSITSYGADGSLDGLLDQPDNLLITKSTNWAIGNPERKADEQIDAADTRVGVPTTVVYRGSERPAVEGLTFRKTGTDRYEATATPPQAGYYDVLDATYAANYPRELGGFGVDPALVSLVQSTGGTVYRPGQAAAIAEAEREWSTRVREVEQDWTWLALALAFALFSAEVLARRIQVYRGRTRSESGLI